jgi:hypothetical protein
MIFLMIKPPYHNGAHDQDRTGDLILTKDVLYRLSYVGWLLLSSKRRFPRLRSESMMIIIGCTFLGEANSPIPNKNGAGNGIRTRDPQLGRLTL